MWFICALVILAGVIASNRGRQAIVAGLVCHALGVYHERTLPDAGGYGWLRSDASDPYSALFLAALICLAWIGRDSEPIKVSDKAGS